MRDVGVDPKDKLLAEAMTLPPEERAALATRLIESLDGPPESRTDDQWLDEIVRRAQDVENAPEKFVDWDIVRAQLDQRFRKP